MIRKTRLFRNSIFLAAFLAVLLCFCKPFIQEARAITLIEDDFNDNSLGAGWTVDISSQTGTEIREINNELRIYAKGNTYAHIEQANSEDNITVRVKIKISDESDMVSWAPGLILYWNTSNWVRISVGGNRVRKIFVMTMTNGCGRTYYYNPVSFDAYYWVAIELTPSKLKTHTSHNGEYWTLLSTQPRPYQFACAPGLIILGKGYGSRDAVYSSPDLDNSFANPGNFSYAYFDDFKTTKDGVLNTPSLRPFPYPYKAGLTIASDIDGSSVPEFLAIHQFLNTKEITPDMGEGVGLEIGDSFWMYTNNHLTGYDEFSYFVNSTATKSAQADLIRAYVHAGYFDSIHSFGSFSRYGGFNRQMGIDALSEMEKAKIVPTVWINHGVSSSNNDRLNCQSIGYSPTPTFSYRRGDLPGSLEYHTDRSLSPEGPLRFLWKEDGGVTLVMGIDSLINITLCDNKKVHAFTRFTGPGWSPRHLKAQLSDINLDTLTLNEGYAIIANHFGASLQQPPFDADTRIALHNLANRQEMGEIYVTTTAKLLRYTFVRDNLNWTCSGDAASGITISITDVADTAFGNFVPTLEDLQGITFYTRCPDNTSVILNGVDVTNLLQINPPDSKGASSISFPLIRLPPLPEWTSDGYTMKTEDYDITYYDYTFSVKNLDTSAFTPTLTYIGLHNFSIQEAEADYTYYIYIPDNRTVHLSRLGPGEIISNLRVLNGTYNPSIPRLTHNSNPNIEVVNATYDAFLDKAFLTLEGAGATDLTILQFSKPFLNATTRVHADGSENVSLDIDGQESFQNVNMSLTPSSGTVTVTIDTWETMDNYFKRWTESSDNPSISVSHTVGDLAPGQEYRVKANNSIIKTLQANENGEINFTYSGQTTLRADFCIESVLEPAIIDMLPASGPVNATVAITGQNFGLQTPSSTVSFGTAATQITQWSDTRITCRVPNLPVSVSIRRIGRTVSQPAPGNYDVKVTNSVGTSNTVTFIVTPTPPFIKSVYPMSAFYDKALSKEIALRGNNFGSYSPSNAIYFCKEGEDLPPVKVVTTSWRNDGAMCLLPALEPGNYHVYISVPEGGDSNRVAFTVTPTPADMSPVITFSYPKSTFYHKGQGDKNIGIFGKNFGSEYKRGVNAIIFTDGVVTENSFIESWRDDRLIAHLPPTLNLKPGKYSIYIVTAYGRNSNRIDFTVDPTPADISPVITFAYPASAKAGTPDKNIVLFGKNFGSECKTGVNAVIYTNGTITVHSFIESWRDDRLICHMPPTLQPGDYTIYAVTSTGKTSNKMNFKVTE